MDLLLRLFKQKSLLNGMDACLSWLLQPKTHSVAFCVFFLYQGEFVNDKRICILAIPKDITAMRTYKDCENKTKYRT